MTIARSGQGVGGGVGCGLGLSETLCWAMFASGPLRSARTAWGITPHCGSESRPIRSTGRQRPLILLTQLETKGLSVSLPATRPGRMPPRRLAAVPGYHQQVQGMVQVGCKLGPARRRRWPAARPRRGRSGQGGGTGTARCEGVPQRHPRPPERGPDARQRGRPARVTGLLAAAGAMARSFAAAVRGWPFTKTAATRRAAIRT